MIIFEWEGYKKIKTKTEVGEDVLLCWEEVLANFNLSVYEFTLEA